MAALTALALAGLGAAGLFANKGKGGTMKGQTSPAPLAPGPTSGFGKGRTAEEVAARKADGNGGFGKGRTVQPAAIETAGTIGAPDAPDATLDASNAARSSLIAGARARKKASGGSLISGLTLSTAAPPAKLRTRSLFGV
jgi:hypothetical protein